MREKHLLNRLSYYDMTIWHCLEVAIINNGSTIQQGAMQLSFLLFCTQNADIGK